MPLAYMNSWASLALRALALVVFAFAHWAAGDGPGGPADLAAASALLLASAAHPMSMALRLGSWPVLALMSAAQAAVAFVLAAMLALGALGIGDGAAVAVPLSVGLAGLAIADGLAQHRRLRRDHAGGWPPLAVSIAAGAAGTALLAALAADAAVSGVHVAGGGLVVGGALALAGWVMHSALRLRRACRAALRARQRDWALVQSPEATGLSLRPSTQPG
jgi:hypothetical protein